MIVLAIPYYSVKKYLKSVAFRFEHFQISLYIFLCRKKVRLTDSLNAHLTERPRYIQCNLVKQLICQFHHFYIVRQVSDLPRLTFTDFFSHTIWFYINKSCYYSGFFSNVTDYDLIKQNKNNSMVILSQLKVN